MVWSEYVNETVWEDNDGSDDDPTADSLPTRLNVDDWTTWYSEHLMNMWMSIREYHEVRYAVIPFGYTDFCEFSWRFSLDGDGTRDVFTDQPVYDVDIHTVWRYIETYLRDSGMRRDILCEATYKEFYEFYISF